MNNLYITRPLLPDIKKMTTMLKDIWESKKLTNVGSQHVTLEAALLKYLKVNQLSLFNNGTIALIVAIQSLRLSGEVITTPFTFPATPHVLTWNGIKPIFCDIDAETLNIDPCKIEKAITPDTTAILGVHVFGTPCEVDAIQKIADYYGLKVVYDAAHAFGVEIDGRGIGTFGDISMFSFHATKLFHTAEGGALSYNDPNLKQRIELLKNFGIKSEEEVMMPGINGKMNELQAALGLCVLQMVEQERQKRKSILEIYRRLLGNIEGISIVGYKSGYVPSYQYFVIRIDSAIIGKTRDQVYEKLKENNIFARKYFYPLCSNYACYKNLPSSATGNLPVANRIVNEVLCLPFYGGLNDDEIAKICDIIINKKKI